MQVGVTQLVCSNMDTPEFLKTAKAAGYEVVELAMKQQGDLTLQTSVDQLHGFRDTAAEVGIELVSMTHTHCTGSLLAPGEPQKTSLDETIAALKAANEMGIRCTLHTLGRPRKEVYYEDAYATAIDSLKQLAPVCEELDVKIAIEFVWNGFLFSPLEMKNLLDTVGSDHIGFYFDPGNMAVFHFPHHWVKLLGSHTKMVHLKDWQGGALNGGWPALLEGEVDYTAMNKELRAIGYDGPMISEVAPSIASLEDTAAAIWKIIQM